MLRVTFETSGGNTDHRTVTTEEEAKAAAIELINAVPNLTDGDKITVVETDETDGA